jgi:hypothetical protein
VRENESEKGRYGERSRKLKKGRERGEIERGGEEYANTERERVRE